MVMNYCEAERILEIHFDGDIDHHSCLELAVASDNAIKKYSPKKLIFDFKNVNFMDSAGIGMVIGRYKQVMRLGGNTEMINLGPDVRRIFNMVGIFKIIPERIENNG